MLLGVVSSFLSTCVAFFRFSPGMDNSVFVVGVMEGAGFITERFPAEFYKYQTLLLTMSDLPARLYHDLSDRIHGCLGNSICLCLDLSLLLDPCPSYTFCSSFTVALRAGQALTSRIDVSILQQISLSSPYRFECGAVSTLLTAYARTAHASVRLVHFPAVWSPTPDMSASLCFLFVDFRFFCPIYAGDTIPACRDPFYHTVVLCLRHGRPYETTYYSRNLH
nr:hypothetical protein Iba_chr12fCG7530 [Ipomoea batatas]